MQFSLTEHARKRILQRGIKLEWIERPLAYPERIENEADDNELVHALIRIPERGFNALRVIFIGLTQILCLAPSPLREEGWGEGRQVQLKQ